MIIKWDSHHILWENHAVHMVQCIVDMDDPTGEKAQALLQEILRMSSEPETIQDMQARANNILDAKYEPGGCPNAPFYGTFENKHHEQ